MHCNANESWFPWKVLSFTVAPFLELLLGECITCLECSVSVNHEIFAYIFVFHHLPRQSGNRKTRRLTSEIAGSAEQIRYYYLKMTHPIWIRARNQRSWYRDLVLDDDQFVTAYAALWFPLSNSWMKSLMKQKKTSRSAFGRPQQQGWFVWWTPWQLVIASYSLGTELSCCNLEPSAVEAHTPTHSSSYLRRKLAN